MRDELRQLSRAALICQRIAALLGIGMPLYKAIETIVLDERDPAYRIRLGRVMNELAAGNALGPSLRWIFPDHL
ncbi:hypothetical protein EBR96_09835, partial [bacterium]|nr:hypothetical protein [bacterium]